MEEYLSLSLPEKIEKVVTTIVNRNLTHYNKLKIGDAFKNEKNEILNVIDIVDNLVTLWNTNTKETTKFNDSFIKLHNPTIFDLMDFLNCCGGRYYLSCDGRLMKETYGFGMTEEIGFCVVDMSEPLVGNQCEDFFDCLLDIIYANE